MDPRRLTLLRHGFAEPARENLEDFDRPLSSAGIEAARRAAGRILALRPTPDLIVTSPAQRTSSTAAIVAEICGLEGPATLTLPRLYLASGNTVWRLLASVDPAARHVIICGHNPGLSDLASRLGPLPRTRDLPTAGFVSARFADRPWSALDPRLALYCD